MTVPRKYPKQEWRQRNADWIRQANNISGQTLIHSGKLNGRVADLSGEEPYTTWQAYQGLLDNPKYLLLFEKDPKVFVEAFWNLYSNFPDTTKCPSLILNDIYHITSSINNRSCKHDVPDQPLIGVINLDLTNYGRTKWWNETGRYFFGSVINPAIEAFGVCVVILNHVIDGRDGAEAALKRFEEHLACFKTLLSKHAGREVLRSEFAPSEKEVQKSILDANFTGDLESIEVYRSRRKRMATIRMHLIKGDFRIERQQNG
jgi:hypothetical protein